MTNQETPARLGFNRDQLIVQVTPYEGNDFPEATNYPEWLAKCLSTNYNMKVEVSEGPTERVQIRGAFEDDLEEEIYGALSEYWERFCDYGYKECP